MTQSAHQSVVESPDSTPTVVDDRPFIRAVESLVEPMQLSRFLVVQSLRKLLPPSIMKSLLLRASKSTPHIGFVIEPYSLFFFFRLKDIERAKSMLPDRYELAKTRIFADEEPDHYMGIGNLSTRASTFWGVRQESYLIARDKETGLLCWIFIDIISNTIIAVPSKGIADNNAAQAMFTTNSHGDVILDIAERKTGRRLAASANIRSGVARPLDVPIWVMGNTSIGHCREMADGDDQPFAVIFDPAEVREGLDIPLDDVTITENSLFPGLAEPELAKVICFPFAQHYIADSPGCQTRVQDPGDLVEKYRDMSGRAEHDTFSAAMILRHIGIASLMFAAVIIGLMLIF